jgi:hypothetical protein
MQQYLTACSTFVLATIKRPLINGAFKAFHRFHLQHYYSSLQASRAIPLLTATDTRQPSYRDSRTHL